MIDAPVVSNRHRVLIVDDHVALRGVLQIMLQKLGLRIVSVGSVTEAKAVLRLESFDAMVVDYYLPDGKGDALYAAAVALQPGLAGRVVFLTGDNSREIQAHLRATRCPVLIKPFENIVLMATVMALLTDARDWRRFEPEAWDA